MKPSTFALVFLLLFLGCLLHCEASDPALRNVTPHPVTNGRMAMGLKGPVKSVTGNSDPTEIGGTSYWFDEQGYITQFYVEPDYGSYSLSVDFIYQTEGDKITEVRMVDEDGQLQGLHTYQYDAEGLLFASSFTQFNDDLIYYGAMPRILPAVHVAGLDCDDHYNDMVWDTKGNLVRFNSYDIDHHPTRILLFTYDDEGFLLREDEMDENAILQSYSIYKYNEEGYCTRITDYDARGKMTYANANSYDQYGNLTSVQYIKADGRVDYEMSFEYEFDEYGNCIFSDFGWGTSNNVYTYYPEKQAPGNDR
jgi:hypothetical protein